MQRGGLRRLEKLGLFMDLDRSGIRLEIALP